MRSIWKGTITFLLVSIPVKVYNAIETSEKISFNQLHAGECLGPVGQRKICKACDAELTNDEIVKGYQHEKDKWVVVAPEEIASITPESSEAIEIIGFIRRDEIPRTYLDVSYFATPNGKGADAPYALLRDVMKRTDRIAIGKVILREREDLITISPDGDGLIIQKLHYRHEVRQMAVVPGIPEKSASDDELALATTLVEQMITSFEQVDTTDHFHTALKAMLEQKVAGEEITQTAATQKPAQVIDIMSALKASLQARATTAEPASTSEPPPPPVEKSEINAAPAQPMLTLVQPPTENKKRKSRKPIAA